jgi:ribonuclease T2
MRKSGPLKKISFIGLICGCFVALYGLFGDKAASRQSGDFDYYILALSWSPEFCDKAPSRAPLQCNGEKRYGLIVHGLWPQYEQGWPSFCKDERLVPQAVRQNMLDIMPDASLIRHQWRKHGSCTGLSPQDYFDLTQKAMARITVPTMLQPTLQDRLTSRHDLLADFATANQRDLSPALSLQCTRNRLREIRVCMRKTLEFRPCPASITSSCPVQIVLDGWQD